MTFLQFIILVGALLVFSPSIVLGVDDPKVLTQPREVSKPKRIARVRVPFRVRGYDKLLVKKLHGKVEEFHRPSAYRSYRLRTRLDKKNDFYVGPWHIESIPIRWSKEKKFWKVQIRIHKMYGKSKELEEFVGSTSVGGTVRGKNLLYDFQGRKGLKFKNTLGQPIADVFIGPFEGAPVAKKSKKVHKTL